MKCGELARIGSAVCGLDSPGFGSIGSGCLWPFLSFGSGWLGFDDGAGRGGDVEALGELMG